MENYHNQWMKENRDNFHLNLMNIKIFEEWCKKNHIKKWLNESNNWSYIVGNLARYNPEVRIPYEDHKAIFKNDKNESVLIIQPYYWRIEEIELWAKSKGIDVKVNPKYSWHFNKQTTLIELRLKDKELFRQAVKDIEDLTR